MPGRPNRKPQLTAAHLNSSISSYVLRVICLLDSFSAMEIVEFENCQIKRENSDELLQVILGVIPNIDQIIVSGHGQESPSLVE